MNRGSNPTNPEDWAAIGRRISATTHDAAQTAATLARSLADRDALVQRLNQQLSCTEQARQHHLEALQETHKSIAQLRAHVSSDRDKLASADARCVEATDQLRQLLRQYGDSPISPQAPHVAHLIYVLDHARSLVDAGVRHLEQHDAALIELTAPIREVYRAAQPHVPNQSRAPSLNATRDVLTRLAIVTESADQSARGLSPTGRTPTRIPPSAAPASAPGR